MTHAEDSGPPLPPRLLRAAAEFERWRSAKTTRAIPDRLWIPAAQEAPERGVSFTARASRLDHYALRRRMASDPASRPQSSAVSYVDLAPIATPMNDGVAEFETAGGAKIDIAWRSHRAVGARPRPGEEQRPGERVVIRVAPQMRIQVAFVTR